MFVEWFHTLIFCFYCRFGIPRGTGWDGILRQAQDDRPWAQDDRAGAQDDKAGAQDDRAGAQDDRAGKDRKSPEGLCGQTR